MSDEEKTKRGKWLQRENGTVKRKESCWGEWGVTTPKQLGGKSFPRFGPKTQNFPEGKPNGGSYLRTEQYIQRGGGVGFRKASVWEGP